MGNKKVAKGPLLYIHQPTSRTPEAPMQSHYMTPKKLEKHEEKASESNKVIKRPANRAEFDRRDTTEFLDGMTSDESSQHADDEHADDKHADDDMKEKGKEFKDLTLKERVDYFLNTPSHVPVMRCEIRTGDQKYRGKIIDYQDESVYMRVGRRTTPTEIPFNTIEEIRLIGF